jgi:type VI secretion system protein ImpK
MSDNPFAEPDRDSDRTVIRPLPGGKARPAAPQPPPSPFGQLPPVEAAHAAAGMFAPADQPNSITMGGSPLLAAAAPLLQLLARLRNTLGQPDAAGLRVQVARELTNFKNNVQGKVAPELLQPAHYALCASLDDVVLASPWAADSPWAVRSLVSEFHLERVAGERFFATLEKMLKEPAAFLPVLELMYFCLSLGFIGKFRLSANPQGEIAKQREQIYEVIRRQRPPAEPALSPHWQGVDAPYKARRFFIPLWLAATVAAGLLALVYGSFLFSLSDRSSAQFAALATAVPAAMPDILRDEPTTTPAPPPGPTILSRLTVFLGPEIAAGQVTILGTTDAPLIRINNKGMFASGSAEVEPGDVAMLQTIGAALSHEQGSVSVTGYTDNQPIHTLQYPSNFELSQARADAAAAILEQSIGDPTRVTAHGLGEADPIGDNTTPEGRALNRRIDVVLNHAISNY